MSIRARAWSMTAAVCVSGLAAAWTSAHTMDSWQPPVPEAGRDSDKPPPEGQDAPLAEQIRDRLRDLDRRRTELQGALDRAEKGEEPSKIRQELGWRRGARGSFGSGGRDNPRGEPEGGPDDRPGGEPPNGPPPREMTPEERDRALVVLQEHLPRVAQRLRVLAESNPELFDRVFARMRPKFQELKNSKQDPELFALRSREIEDGMNVVEAVRAYRSAGEDDRDGARRTLREAIAAQFDSQLALRRHEVTMLGQRIERLKTEIAEKQSKRENLIDAQLEQMLQRSDKPKRPRGHDGTEPGSGPGGR